MHRDGAWLFVGTVPFYAGKVERCCFCKTLDGEFLYILHILFVGTTVGDFRENAMFGNERSGRDYIEALIRKDVAKFKQSIVVIPVAIYHQSDALGIVGLN